MALSPFELRPYFEARIVSRVWKDSSFRKKLEAEGAQLLHEVDPGWFPLEISLIFEEPNEFTFLVPRIDKKQCLWFPEDPERVAEKEEGFFGAPFFWARKRDEQALFQKVQSDESLRQQLLMEPRKMLTNVPDGITIRTVEESYHELEMVIPQSPSRAEEIDLKELEESAGCMFEYASATAFHVAGGIDMTTPLHYSR